MTDQKTYKAGLIALADEATGKAEAGLAEPWRSGVTGAALSFEPGVLNVNRDGSGSLAFRESILEIEQSDDGGADYWFANLPASEVLAIRDFLNTYFPPALTAGADGVAAEREACEHCDGTGDVHNIAGEWLGVCPCPAGDPIRARMGDG